MTETTMHETTMQMMADPPGSADSKKDVAASLAREAGEEAKAVTKDVRAHGQQLVSTSVEQLHAQASEQTTRLAEGLRDATHQLRSLKDGSPQPGMVTDLVQQLADATQRAADRLSDGGLDGAMRDLRKVARNQTGLFLLGALGAGMVAGRVLRAADTRSIAETAKEAFTGESDADDQRPSYLASRPSVSSTMAPPVAVGTMTGAPSLGAER